MASVGLAEYETMLRVFLKIVVGNVRFLEDMILENIKSNSVENSRDRWLFVLSF